MTEERDPLFLYTYLRLPSADRSDVMDTVVYIDVSVTGCTIYIFCNSWRTASNDIKAFYKQLIKIGSIRGDCITRTCVHVTFDIILRRIILCGLVTPYDDKDLKNIDLASLRQRYINMRAISRETFHSSLKKLIKPHALPICIPFFWISRTKICSIPVLTQLGIYMGLKLSWHYLQVFVLFEIVWNWLYISRYVK